jgi:glutathione peroxidase-family protein
MRILTDYLSFFSGTQAERVNLEIRKELWKRYKSKKKKKQQITVPWNWAKFLEG